jgi:hypothetical protein
MIRETIELKRSEAVVDKGKREYDRQGEFVGFNKNKKVCVAAGKKHFISKPPTINNNNNNNQPTNPLYDFLIA